MAQQLIYSTVAEGIDGGRGNLCYAAASPGALQNKLILNNLLQINNYQQLFSYQKNNDQNPINYCHYNFSLGNTDISIVSRISATEMFGARSNFFAHHLILEKNELPEYGPAKLIKNGFSFKSKWDYQQNLDIPLFPVKLPEPQGLAKYWASIKIDPGWAGWVAEKVLAGKPVHILYPEAISPLSLIDDIVSLTQPHQRWKLTFSTYYTLGGNGPKCLIQCIPLKAANYCAPYLGKTPAENVINLLGNLGLAPSSDLSEMARGKRKSPPVQEHFPPTHPTTKRPRLQPDALPISPIQKNLNFSPSLIQDSILPSTLVPDQPLFSFKEQTRDSNFGGQFALLLKIICGLLLLSFWLILMSLSYLLPYIQYKSAIAELKNQNHVSSILLEEFNQKAIKGQETLKTEAKKLLEKSNDPQKQKKGQKEKSSINDKKPLIIKSDSFDDFVKKALETKTDLIETDKKTFEVLQKNLFPDFKYHEVNLAKEDLNNFLAKEDGYKTWLEKTLSDQNIPKKTLITGTKPINDFIKEKVMETKPPTTKEKLDKAKELMKRGEASAATLKPLLKSISEYAIKNNPLPKDLTNPFYLQDNFISSLLIINLLLEDPETKNNFFVKNELLDGSKQLLEIYKSIKTTPASIEIKKTDYSDGTDRITFNKDNVKLKPTRPTKPFHIYGPSDHGLNLDDFLVNITDKFKNTKRDEKSAILVNLLEYTITNITNLRKEAGLE